MKFSEQPSIGRIKQVLTRARSLVLVVPRLSCQYLLPILLPNLSVFNLGTPKTQEISDSWNFLNSLIPRTINSRDIGRIRTLLIVGQFSVLCVPRLLHSYFVAYFVTFTVNVRTFSCNIIFQKYDTSILEILAGHTLTLFALPRIQVSPHSFVCLIEELVLHHKAIMHACTVDI